jgi:phospholipid/cholesterol/gamma-HCH transport system substrate-binding protein
MSARTKREMRVGAFILAVIVILLFVVFTIGGTQNWFADRTSYRIQFASTAGLYKGDPVLLTGVEVGNVSRIGFPESLEEKRIVVEITVQKDASMRIRRDTRGRIGSASIVYGKVVLLSMGSPDQPAVPAGGFIEADESSSMSAIVDSTSSVIDGLLRVISKIDRGGGAIGTALNEPLELKRTLHNLSVASERLVVILDRMERGQSPLGALVSDSTADFRKTVRDVQAAAEDLRAVAANLKGGQGALGRLINDPEYMDGTLNDLQSAARSLARVSAKLDTGAGTLGLLINDPELYDGLRDVVIGTKKSTVAKWLIRNRRNAGEDRRLESGPDSTEGR